VEGRLGHPQVVSHRRGPKIIVYKIAPKKKTRFAETARPRNYHPVMVESITVAATDQTDRLWMLARLGCGPKFPLLTPPRICFHGPTRKAQAPPVNGRDSIQAFLGVKR